MPALDRITISTTNLQDIQQALISKQHTGPVVIIDTIQSWTIRDIHEMFLTEVKKEETITPQPQTH